MQNDTAFILIMVFYFGWVYIERSRHSAGKPPLIKRSMRTTGQSRIIFIILLLGGLLWLEESDSKLNQLIDLSNAGKDMSGKLGAILDAFESKIWGMVFVIVVAARLVTMSTEKPETSIIRDGQAGK